MNITLLHENLFSLVRLEAKPHKGFFESVQLNVEGA
jgi:hypothetical protein